MERPNSAASASPGCTSGAVGIIAAGERDPLLCAWGIASDRKGRHGLAGKLFAAASALE